MFLKLECDTIRSRAKEHILTSDMSAISFLIVIVIIVVNHVTLHNIKVQRNISVGATLLLASVCPSFNGPNPEKQDHH